MKTVILILTSALILSSCKGSFEQSPTSQKTQLAGNIVDGHVARKFNSFGKSAVFIVLQNENGIPETCSGSFISPHHILTAAHCVTANTDDTSLSVGVNPIEEESEMVLTIDKIIVHPDYSKDNDKERNDLAIIKFKETYDREKFIFKLPTNFVTLLQYNSFIKTVTAVGYGQTGAVEGDENQGDSVGVLRYVKLDADLSLEKNIIVNQSTGGGVCFGDSGGSITVKYRKDKYIVGVSSGVFDDNTEKANITKGPIDYCRHKSIFMNVIYYLPWIQQTMAL